jgi:hypothetical protein
MESVPKYQEFEEALAQFKKNWNIQENRELEHWSGLGVWERCVAVKLSDHYDQFRWLSQSTHLSPIVLEFFVRNIETGYEYLEGPSHKRTSEYATRLILIYSIVCSQLIDWFGLWQLREELGAFSKKILSKINSEMEKD